MKRSVRGRPSENTGDCLQTEMTIQSIQNSLQRYKRKEYSSSDFPGFHRAGVLVPLLSTPDGVSVLLTVRTDSVETHKGQISFPGGMMDKRDKDAIGTALRESAEEIGLKPEDVDVLGLLDDAVVPSRFIITPVVGLLHTRPLGKPSETEVAEVFQVPLAFFADDKNCERQEREVDGRRFPLWFYNYNGKVIWGATAGIIRNLLAVQPSTG
jgi:8-oxo-dGTP pyrophosphatase MutT (NUDIX family)